MSYSKDMSYCLVIIFISIIIELFVGSFLSKMDDELAILPGLLIVIPGTLAMRGNIYSAMGSRLGTTMHLGLIPKKFRLTKEFNLNIYSTLFLTLITATFLSSLATFSVYLLDESVSLISVFFKLLAIVMISGICAGLILSFCGFLMTIFVSNRGIDPDNILSPSLATIGDLITIMFLFMTANFVLGV